MAEDFVAKVGIELEADKSGNSGIADQILKEFQLVESKASKLSFLDEKTVRQQMNSIVKMINGNLKGIDFSHFTNGLLQSLSKGSKGAKEFRQQLDNTHTIMSQISNASGFSDIRKSMTELSPSQMEKVIKLYQKQQTLQVEYDAAVAQGKQKALNIEAKQLKSLARMKEITGSAKYQKAISDANISTTAKMLQLDANKSTVQTDVKEYSRLISIYDILIEKRERLNKSSKITDAQELVETNKTLLSLQEQISRKETALKQKYGVTKQFSTELQLVDFDEKTLKKNIQSSIDHYAQISAGKAAKQLENATNLFKTTVDKEATKNLQRRTEAQTIRSAKIQESIQKTTSSQDTSNVSEEVVSDFGNITQAAKETEQAVESVSRAFTELNQNSVNQNLPKNFADIEKYLVSQDEAIEQIAELEDQKLTLQSEIDELSKSTDEKSTKLVDAKKEQIDLLGEEQSKYFARLQSLGVDESILKDELTDDVYLDLSDASEDLSLFDSKTQKAIKSIQEFKQEAASSASIASDLLTPVDTKSQNLSLEQVQQQQQQVESLLAYDDKTGALSLDDALVDYYNKFKDTNAYLQRGNELIEERALLFKKGQQVGEEFVSSSDAGMVDIGKSVTELGADTVLHTHPLNEAIDNLRFSDADIKNLIDGSLSKAILLCGEEIATLDMDGIDKSQFANLQQDILGAYQAVFARYGAIIEDGKISGIENLPADIQNQATNTINNLLTDILRQYGGNVYFDKQELDDNQRSMGTMDNDIQRIIPIDDSEIKILDEFRQAAASDNATERLIQLQQKYQIALAETQQQAKEVVQTLNTHSDANIEQIIADQQQLQQELEETKQKAKETEQALESVDNVKTESIDIDTSVANKDKALVDETQTVADISGSETSDLLSLKSAIEGVTQAVNEKTAAFEKEKSTVQEVVSSEIADLDKLSNKLDAVGKALAEAKENAKIVSEQVQTLDLNSTTQKTTETSTDTSTSQKSSKKDVSEVTKVTNALNRLIKTEVKYQELTAKQQANKITAKEAATLEKITIAREKDLDVINSTTKYTDLQIKKQLEWNQAVQDGQRVAQAFNNALANEKSATANKKQEKITDIINNADNKLKQSIGKFTTNNQTLTGSAQVVDRVQNKFEELNATFRAGGMSIADYNRDIKTLTTGLDSAKDEADDLTQAMLKMKQEALNRGASEYNIKTDEDKGTVTAFYTDKNTKEIIQFTQAYNDMSGTISHHTKTNGKEMGAFSKALSGWKGKVGEVVRYFASFGGAYEIWNVFKQGVGIIKDLDDALTEMSKVSDESLSTLQAFQKESFVLADNVGGTGQIIQQSTADWQRLGESLAEAKKSAQASTVLFNVSEFDNIDSATDSLVAMSQAYSDMDKMDIIDKLNNIGNNYSIATDGIATALQKSASALKTANNDIDESIALITAGNAVVQDPDSVGAGIRTIALRIQGTKEAKAELQSMGEDVEDYVVQTSSKINETVKNFTAVASNDYKGISVLDANGNYRSTYEILQDIADIYDEIVATDKQLGTNHMAGLLETLAGKNRANIAASILQNGDMLRSVYQDSQTSEGSALEENEKYMESISGHLDQLKNKWQEVWANTATRDSINMVIDLGKALLEVVDTIGLFPTAGIFGAIFGGLYNFEKTGPLLSQALAQPKTWLQTNFIIKWGYYHKGYYIMA